MEKWEGKVAVVTGASGYIKKYFYLWINLMIITISTVGIGAALCRALVEAGMVVCGMSKRKDKMEVRIVIKTLEVIISSVWKNQKYLSTSSNDFLT